MSRGYRDEDDDRRDTDDELGQDVGMAEAIAESPDGLKVRMEDGKEHWIPKSYIHADSEVYARGHEGILIVMPWLARKRGWID